MTAFLQATIAKFIFRVKADCWYTDAGLWLAPVGDAGAVRIGLTDFMQQSSGDIAFLDLPPAGRRVEAGEELATIETVKVDVGLVSPCAGLITAVNEGLAEAPERINQDPYGDGWLVELKPDVWPIPGLLDAPAYLRVMTAQAEAAA